MSTFSMKKVKTFAKETKLEFGVIAEQNYSPRKTDNRKISASEMRQFKAACPIPLIKDTYAAIFKEAKKLNGGSSPSVSHVGKVLNTAVRGIYVSQRDGTGDQLPGWIQSFAAASGQHASDITDDLFHDTIWGI